ncbi:hypothetical protein [Achromobacter xylosoxidans]|nr:hypothetical protein [Achromobacter xylosoxidans]CUI55722.1 Uncharacterised protein [Achromobacter xylosoxidans]
MHTWTITTTTAGTFNVRASSRDAAMRTAAGLLESWGYEDARILSIA